MKFENIIYLIGGLFLIVSSVCLGVNITSIFVLYLIFGIIYILHFLSIFKMDKDSAKNSLLFIFISCFMWDFIAAYIKVTQDQGAAWILLFSYIFDLIAIAFVIKAILYGYISKNILDKKL